MLPHQVLMPALAEKLVGDNPILDPPTIMQSVLAENWKKMEAKVMGMVREQCARLIDMEGLPQDTAYIDEQMADLVKKVELHMKRQISTLPKSELNETHLQAVRDGYLRCVNDVKEKNLSAAREQVNALSSTLIRK